MITGLSVSTICLTRISSSFYVIGDENIGPKFSAKCFAIQDRICDRVCKCESRPPAELGPPRPSVQSGYNRFLSFSFSLSLPLPPFERSLSYGISHLRPTPRSKREAETGPGPPRKECVGWT